MNCGWALPRAARLAAAMAAVLNFGEAHAATPIAKFLAGTYAMTDVNGGGFHSLTITPRHSRRVLHRRRRRAVLDV
jgi:hypothetical protein